MLLPSPSLICPFRIFPGTLATPPFLYALPRSQPAVPSPIVVFMPGSVLDIQDAPANSSQHVQVLMKDVLNLQQVLCYLGPLGTKEARKGTLLSIFPAGKMVLTVAYLERS